MNPACRLSHMLYMEGNLQTVTLQKQFGSLYALEHFTGTLLHTFSIPVFTPRITVLLTTSHSVLKAILHLW